jgi:endonuclease-8
LPEGHTIHRLAAEHARLLAGRPVRAASPQGRFAAGAARVSGATLAATEAYGKHLYHHYRRPGGEPVMLHVHLGLIGTFAAGPQPAPAPVGALRLRLENDDVWVDLRGPNTCELHTEADQRALYGRLGADPLRSDADPERAAARIARSRAPIGQLMMDQAVLAGVGNIYRAELLFRHRVDPYLPGRDLARARWRRMWPDLVELMREGVRVGRIDTVRPEHEPAAMGRPPRVDRHGGEVYVYRRAGQPCLVCGTRVRTAVLAGRNLYWCPRCQRPSRRRATTGTATGARAAR